MTIHHHLLAIFKYNQSWKNKKKQKTNKKQTILPALKDQNAYCENLASNSA